MVNKMVGKWLMKISNSSGEELMINWLVHHRLLKWIIDYPMVIVSSNSSGYSSGATWFTIHLNSSGD